MSPAMGKIDRDLIMLCALVALAILVGVVWIAVNR